MGVNSRGTQDKQIAFKLHLTVGTVGCPSDQLVRRIKMRTQTAWSYLFIALPRQVTNVVTIDHIFINWKYGKYIK